MNSRGKKNNYMTKQLAILTEEQVAEISSGVDNLQYSQDDVSTLCASHEALRARVAELELESDDLHRHTIPRIQDTVRIHSNEIERLKAELVRHEPIARLAREWYAAEQIQDQGLEGFKAFSVLFDAVQKEGK
jgi:hypothetical protein